MLNFKKIGEGLTEDKELFSQAFLKQNTHISDYSLGFQSMWGENLQVDYCIAGECLVLHEFYAGSHYFYYPLHVSGDNEEAEKRALDAIEEYCRDNDIRLHYTNIPHNKLMILLERYGHDCSVNNRRRWRDYLYNAEDFKTYAGKKYSGQRNHVNKFLKSYPIWQFRPYEAADEPALIAFLQEFAESQRAKNEFLAKEEIEETLEMVPKFRELGFVCGLLTVENKIVGFSAGEVCGDMLVVHIEKARKDYEGAYPMLAQQFARAFCKEGVKYTNRMDDAGDKGLRKSKLQYLPCELVGKFTVLPRRAIDALSKYPEFETERLTIAPVRDEDARAYARLARDRERNRWWGYDWREDFPDGEPEENYFLETARSWFHKKWEIFLGVYQGDALVGEVVMHRFGYRENVEIGVRLLPEAEGNGYASEAMHALAQYAFLKMNMETVEAKCFKENIRSDKMLRAAGFRLSGEDETYFYYKMTAAM